VREFRDRRDAGERLAARLASFASESPVIVGLPRGGVVVAAAVAEALHAPLDVVVVRKLGVPTQPELGMGAVGEDGVIVRTEAVIQAAGVTPEQFDAVVARERAEVARRATRFRGDRAPVPLHGRTVIVVDDGIATGGTARAALEVVRAQGAQRVVLAVPVAPPEALRDFAAVADEVVCLEAPRWFQAVGTHYADFTQTSDQDVVDLLQYRPGSHGD
jgi:putative phosphoribosyl transferase